MHDLYFHFLRFSLGIEDICPDFRKHIDWNGLVKFAHRQAMSGIIFDGIKKLPKEMAPPRPIIYNMLAISERIRRMNQQQSIALCKIFRKLRKDNLECCILKGQGNSLLYPNPYSRTPGDIDVWINASRKAINEYANEHLGDCRCRRYNHIELYFDKIPVEIHFIPSLMNNPFYNRRLQEWFRNNAHAQCANAVTLPGCKEPVAVPTKEFNVIFQLSHLYHHFFDEGIGLKQITDYYFLLTKYVSSANKEKTKKLLKHLGLRKFAGAIMYVMDKVYGMKEEHRLVPIDGRRGKVLMEDILHGGNFGQYNPLLDSKNKARRFFLKSYRTMHFIRLYPSETLCEPIFRTYHFLWRKWRNY